MATAEPAPTLAPFPWSRHEFRSEACIAVHRMHRTHFNGNAPRTFRGLFRKHARSAVAGPQPC